MQLLFKIQIPIVIPTIIPDTNQIVMMALAMSTIPQWLDLGDKELKFLEQWASA